MLSLSHPDGDSISHQENGQIEDPKSIKNILTLNKASEDAQER